MSKKINYADIEHSSRVGNIILKAFTYLMLTLWALVVLFPFIWMIQTSENSIDSY